LGSNGSGFRKNLALEGWRLRMVEWDCMLLPLDRKLKPISARAKVAEVLSYGFTYRAPP